MKLIKSQIAWQYFWMTLGTVSGAIVFYHVLTAAMGS